MDIDTTKKVVRVGLLIRVCLLFLTAVLQAPIAVGQTQENQAVLLYSIISASDPGVDGSVNIVQFDNNAIDQLELGLDVILPLPNGSIASGRVSTVTAAIPLLPQSLPDVDQSVVVTLESVKGSVELHVLDKQVVAMTLYQVEDDQFHRVVLDRNNTGPLLEQDADQFICVDMPVHTASETARPHIDFTRNTPDETSLKELQSREGADKVLFLDYWGGTINETYPGPNVWNATYGPNIFYEPFDSNGDTSTFDALERYQIYRSWLEVVEDFSMSDVNITTSRAVYDATPDWARSKVIATTAQTRDFYGICNGQCGGVAYKPSFGNNYYNIGFTFNNTLGSTGMTHSHEAGHQFGLSHDGGFSGPYYTGHQYWGPIMGAPFDKPYVHWSKGEYLGANNNENDLDLISVYLDVLPDDVADNEGDAEALELPADLVRKLSPRQYSANQTGDVDVFTFNLDHAAHLNIVVAPEIGLEMLEGAGGEQAGANLALNVQLYNADTSELLASINSFDANPLRPDLNKFEFDGLLDSSHYYLAIEAESPDPDWLTGFGEYGNTGRYRLIIEQSNSVPEPVDVLLTPLGAIQTAQPEFAWQPSANATEYRLYARSIDTSDDLLYTSWMAADSLLCQSASCQFTPLITFSGSVRWRVQARNSIGKSAWSGAGIFNNSSEQPPPPVTQLLSPTGGAEQGAQEFRWGDIESASHYRIFIKDAARPEENYLSTWLSRELLACSDDAVCDFNYSIWSDGSKKWRIQAKNEAGKSDWSEAGKFKLGQLPAAVTALAPNGGSLAGPDFSWLAVENADTYRLVIKDRVAGVIVRDLRLSPEDLACVSAGETCVINPNINLATNYRWWVRAINSIGNGPWSLPQNFSIP